MSDYITVDGQTYTADRIRRLRAKSERLTEAINNAIDTANGRETEWGDRAQMAFEHLHDAIRSNEQADAAILKE